MLFDKASGGNVDSNGDCDANANKFWQLANEISRNTADINEESRGDGLAPAGPLA